MSQISGELRKLLDDIEERCNEEGVDDVIVIMGYKGDGIISTRLSPQKTLMYLIDSLQTAKNQCLQNTRRGTEAKNN